MTGNDVAVDVLPSSFQVAVHAGKLSNFQVINFALGHDTSNDSVADLVIAARRAEVLAEPMLQASREVRNLIVTYPLDRVRTVFNFFNTCAASNTVTSGIWAEYKVCRSCMGTSTPRRNRGRCYVPEARAAV